MIRKPSKTTFNYLEIRKTFIRYILYFFLINLLITIVYIYKHQSNFMFKEIYAENTNSLNGTIRLQTLEDVVNKESIFFIETRSNITAQNVLNKRESCAVESAALNNPEKTIYVLFPSAGPIDLSKTTLYVKAILQYPNVGLRRISMTEYMKGTPLETWYSSGVLNTSAYIVSHTSNVLRLITLWKYGGVYLDLDTVTLRSLDGLTPCLALESDNVVGSALIAAPSEGIGHRVILKALQQLKEISKGDYWDENGSVLLTNVLRSVCNISVEELASSMINKHCEGFNMYPPSYFYPVAYYDWMQYFANDSEADTTMSIIKESYIVHLWNKMSYLEPVVVDSRQPYARIAKKYCPRVNQNSGDEL